MRQSTVLRELLGRPEILVAAGCYECVSARLVERAGFRVAYLTGYGTSATLLGKPDYGYINQVEMVTHGRNVANSIAIPLISDADTAYGNVLNTIRTVQEFERAGVAAIHIEDQTFPKRCGHMEGKQVISTKEHAMKIRAAVEAREDMLIIARTDARAPLGLDEAIERGLAYREAGADIIFVDAPQSEREMQAIGERIKAPLLINMTEGGKTPQLSSAELQQMGYRIVIYPITAMLAGVRAMEMALRELREKGTTQGIRQHMRTFGELNEIIGLKGAQDLEERYRHDL
jgi:methylisocitrate lyase